MPATILLPQPATARMRETALPAELGSVLLTIATNAVPIRVVSRLARHLATALDGRLLTDADVAVLAGLLARAAGPWRPAPKRFAALVNQVGTRLTGIGCSAADVQAVLTDLDDVFTVRRAHAPRLRWG